jgi:hypothetical protein
VRQERALKSQVCCSNGQERCLTQDGRVFIAQTPKTSSWKGSAHFTVKLKYNSRLDHQEGNDYFDSNFSIVVGLAVRPPWNRSWRSDQSPLAVRPPWIRGWLSDWPLVAIRLPGAVSSA